MNVIRNFKGEAVQTEHATGGFWRWIPGEMWGGGFGLLFLLLGHFVPEEVAMSILHFFDIRLWAWEHILLMVFITSYVVGCWHIRQSWDYYDEDEKRHAISFICFGLTVVIVVVCLVILFLSNRFVLFFRPMIQMFSAGRFSLTGFWRLAIIITSSVLLVHFGKEWILGFYDK